MFLVYGSCLKSEHFNVQWGKKLRIFSLAETEKGIFNAILEGEIDFVSDPWPSISDSAKDLVRKMLTQDPKKRITSAQVLGITLLLQFWLK